MVKIVNAFGDVKKGKQHTAVYQNVYGNQTRRTLKAKKDEHTRGQLEQRDRFKIGIDFATSLTKPQRDFIKSYMAEAGIRSPDGLPTTWYSFAKKIAMTRPKVEMKTESGGCFGAPYQNWNYRKPINLNNQSGGALTDYQVLITLTTSNFPYAKCKNDGSDIRFSQDNKTSPLQYWIEDWNYSGTSKIWVKVDSVPTGQNICLYLYYGNNAAESESNGDNTFPFFDDFPGSSLDTDKWAGDTGSASVSSSILTLTSSTQAWKKLYNKVGTYGLNYAIRHKIAFPSIASNRFLVSGFTEPAQHGQESAFFQELTDGYYFYNFAGGSSTGYTYTTDTSYHVLEVGRFSTGNHYFKDGVEITNSPITQNITTANLNLLLQAYNGNLLVDWVFIQKYTSTEPTIQEIGDEEESGGGTKLNAFSIHHPAIKSYEIMDNGPKEENLSNLENHISNVITRKNLDLAASKIKVKTLANQEYEFTIK